MVIISYRVIRDFAARYPMAVKPLEQWYDLSAAADWPSLNALRQTFPNADYVGNERVVFNIGGNKYRLIAAINFSIRTVFIKFVGTHAEYDKIDATTINRF